MPINKALGTLALTTIFRTLDTDGDGTLSLEEFAMYKSARSRALKQDKAETVRIELGLEVGIAEVEQDEERFKESLLHDISDAITCRDLSRFRILALEPPARSGGQDRSGGACQSPSASRPDPTNHIQSMRDLLREGETLLERLPSEDAEELAGLLSCMDRCSSPIQMALWAHLSGQGRDEAPASACEASPDGDGHVSMKEELAQLLEEGRTLLGRLPSSQAAEVTKLLAGADRSGSPVARALQMHAAGEAAAAAKPQAGPGIVVFHMEFENAASEDELSALEVAYLLRAQVSDPNSRLRQGRRSGAALFLNIVTEDDEGEEDEDGAKKQVQFVSKKDLEQLRVKLLQLYHRSDSFKREVGSEGSVGESAWLASKAVSQVDEEVQTLQQQIRDAMKQHDLSQDRYDELMSDLTSCVSMIETQRKEHRFQVAKRKRERERDERLRRADRRPSKLPAGMLQVKEQVYGVTGADGRPKNTRHRLVVPYCSGFWHFEKIHHHKALKLQSVFRGHVGRAAHARIRLRIEQERREKEEREREMLAQYDNSHVKACHTIQRAWRTVQILNSHQRHVRPMPLQRGSRNTQSIIQRNPSIQRSSSVASITRTTSTESNKSRISNQRGGSTSNVLGSFAQKKTRGQVDLDISIRTISLCGDVRESIYSKKNMEKAFTSALDFTGTVPCLWLDAAGTQVQSPEPCVRRAISFQNILGSLNPFCWGRLQLLTY